MHPHATRLFTHPWSTVATMAWPWPRPPRASSKNHMLVAPMHQVSIFFLPYTQLDNHRLQPPPSAPSVSIHTHPLHPRPFTSHPWPSTSIHVHPRSSATMTCQRRQPPPLFCLRRWGRPLDKASDHWKWTVMSTEHWALYTQHICYIWFYFSVMHSSVWGLANVYPFLRVQTLIQWCMGTD